MTDYAILFQRNPKPSDIPNFCQPGFFFNEPEHLQQQSANPLYVLTALNQRTGSTEARCAFFANDREAVSPYAAPFGSIEFAETLPELVLDTFLYALSKAVRLPGTLTTLRLIHYPACYAPEQTARLLAKLLKHGIQLTRTDQTFYLPINGNPFTQIIAPAERRRLRKCQEAGFQFRHWVEPTIIDVVNFIQATRQQRGYQLTIYPENLVGLLQRFPEQFPVFIVNDSSRLAALVVCVRVRADILYTFLPASHPDYRTFSPTVMLMDGLYTYCQKQRIQILDLGTSLNGDDQPKSSLMRFKRNLGALESPKMIFEKRF